MLNVSLACAFVSAALREDRVTFGSPLLLTVIVRNGKFFAYLAELCFLSLPFQWQELSAHQFNIVINLKSCIKICTQC